MWNDKDWGRLHLKLADVANSLRPLAGRVEGNRSDPKIVAAALFSRAYSHVSGFNVLWNSKQLLECEIVLRSLLETAIALSALRADPPDMARRIEMDAAHTFHGQLRMAREAFDAAWVDELSALAEEMGKGARLDLADLTRRGDHIELYVFHRFLSGTAAHITGISLLRMMDLGADEVETEAQLRARVMYWAVLAQASAFADFAYIIDAIEPLERVSAMMEAIPIEELAQQAGG